MKTLNRKLVFPAIAIVCFAVAWFIASGHGVIGTEMEWLLAGLIALAAAHLP